MTLKEAQKEYPDAIRMELTVRESIFSKYNLYKQEELKEYLSEILPNTGVLYCNCSGYRVIAITSKEAYKEELRQRTMIPGTKVIMTGSEGDLPQYKDKVWNVYAGPKWMSGGLVVWIKGFSGAYSCKYLKIVENTIE